MNAQGYTTIARKNTVIPNGATVYVNYKWPSSGTRGSATIQLPQLSEYYRSWLSYYYLMPSLGTNDIFSLHWEASGAPGTNESVYGFPTGSSWQGVTRELSNGNTVKLARKAGTLWFQFFDMTPGAGGVKNGQGPAIDDLKVIWLQVRPGARGFDVAGSW